MRKNYESDPNIETSDLTLKLAVLFPKDGRVPFRFVAVPLDWNFLLGDWAGRCGKPGAFFLRETLWNIFRHTILV